MKVYVVNGHESRKSGFLKACTPLHLEVEFVKSYTLDDPELLEKGKDHLENNTCTVGLLSCTMTHMKCMQKIVDSNEPFGVIVEDDVRFHKQWNDLIDICYNYMTDNFESVDILSIGFVNIPHSNTIVHYNGMKIIENVSLGNPWGAQCYMISRSYAITFLELFREDFYKHYKGPFSADWVIFDPIIGCRRSTLSIPFVVESESEQPSAPSNKPNLFQILKKDEFYYD